MTLKQVLEALVFASPKPLLTKEIMAALRAAAEAMEDDAVREYAKASEEQVLAALAEVGKDYVETGRPFRLVEQVNGWSMVTDPMAAPWVRQLYPEAKPTRLSGPALETLAIIAYRQPVTRADIEAVRGVAVDGVMQVLLDRSLVKIAGRAEVPGRPLLYSTTEYFLQHFGLKTVEELPNAGELRRIPLPQAPPPEEKSAKPEKTPEEKPAKPEKPAGERSEPKKKSKKAEPEAVAPVSGTVEIFVPEEAEDEETPEPSLEPEEEMPADAAPPEPATEESADDPQPES